MTIRGLILVTVLPIYGSNQLGSTQLTGDGHSSNSIVKTIGFIL